MAFDRWVNSATAFAMPSISISILSSEPSAALAADQLGMLASPLHPHVAAALAGREEVGTLTVPLAREENKIASRRRLRRAAAR
jgi:hypothetical protein